MIVVTEYPRTLPVATPGVVTLTLTGAAPVTHLEVDLLGDGQAALTTLWGDDLRVVRGLAWVPRQRGVYGLQVRASDLRGCTDATGARREVTVR